jgi:hypothetical protein
MPKREISYSKTIFYKIVCNDLNITECYVGHTTNFIKRKYNHHRSCINDKVHNHNQPIYIFIRNNGGWDNWTMIMIDEISCENSLQACKIERKFIEDLKASLNIRIPSKTKKELYEEKKEERLDYAKNYREQHKEKIFKQSQKQIYCDCCKIDMRYSDRARHNKSSKHIKNIEAI